MGLASSKPKGVVLFIITSTENASWEAKTGYWLEEVAEPYYAFIGAGYEVHFASIAGGKPPCDPTSQQDEYQTENTRKFESDENIQELLASSTKLSEVDNDYQCIFLPGGHGTCFDIATNEHIAFLLPNFLSQGGVVAAVCHGPVGLTKALKADGTPLVQGVKVTGFTNSEEEAVNLHKKVPFLLESKLKDLGAEYSCGNDWEPYVVVDGNLVTGQNPKSSTLTAEEAIKILETASPKVLCCQIPK